MAEKQDPVLENTSGPIKFQTEIKELLNILVHSLYTRQEIFLRELISNASDALTQMRFIQQTEREILDPSLDLVIRIELNPEEGILRVVDTGVGMTQEELQTNLGTIAQSGARAFLAEAEGKAADLVDVIGRFGVGFYSVFMAADWVKVTTRSFRPEAEAGAWYATGADTFEIGSAAKKTRGTTIEIKLKKDAEEFLDPQRIKEVVRTHSNYVPFPIYLDGEEQQINQGTAIWRERPQEVSEEQYQEFYRQLTLEINPALDWIHFVADAPLMIYALLYLPATPDRGLFTLRDQDGLKLYARKILIEDYSQDLLPPYLRFIQGVVDAEDLPLNVSRESVQATGVINKLRKILTNQVIQKLKGMAQTSPEEYLDFWTKFGQFIKEGLASRDEYQDDLPGLLRFRSTTSPDEWISLDEYIKRLKPGQDRIYYILGDDEHSISRSPHLDYFQTHCYEVLTLTDPVDSFMLLGLRDYQEYPLQNVADSDLELPDPTSGEEEEEKETKSLSQDGLDEILEAFKTVLGDQVAEVRTTNRLTSSVARLVDAQGSLGQELQRVYRMMDRDYVIPKKVLEINPGHRIIIGLSELEENDGLRELIIEQIFSGALMIEGLHPDPASTIPAVQELIQAALENH